MSIYYNCLIASQDNIASQNTALPKMLSIWVTLRRWHFDLSKAFLFGRLFSCPLISLRGYFAH